MTIVASLESMGLVVKIDSAGGLALSGLQSLSTEERRVVVDMAKGNRPAIMEELRRRSRMEDAPAPDGSLPIWVRAYTPGEALDDTQERRCVSSRCAAVFMRQGGESDESWSNKRYCTGQCFSGQPSIPLEVLQ